MNRRQVSIAVSCALSLCCAPAPAHKSDQVRTQLQTREFQTRTYETTDTNMIMKALLNVLQDDGFIIKNANENLGLIAATKETENPDTPALLWLRTELRWDKTFVFECSANVSEFGHQTKVRVNFEERTINNRGEVSHVKDVDDPAYYRNFFTKVDKGVFIQKEKL